MSAETASSESGGVHHGAGAGGAGVGETSSVPWPVVMVAGFVVPGAAHFLHGERRRGVFIGAAVVVTFVLGVWIGGVRVVEFPRGTGSLLAAVLGQPAFIAQFFAGPLTLVAGWVSKGLLQDPATQDIVSHARLWDIGQLYTAVAGAMNLLALIDATSRRAANLPSRDRLLVPEPPADTGGATAEQERAGR